MLVVMKKREIEKILKALGNRRRLEIVAYLKRNKNVSVGDIAAVIHLSFRSTSRHLRILFAADILGKKQRGLEVLYSVAKNQKLITRVIIKSLS